MSLANLRRPCIPFVHASSFKKGSFYIAQYPVRLTAQSALHFLPSLTDLFIPTPFSASPGSILARQQLRAKTKSLTFPPLSIVRYSFIQLSRQGRQWREGKCPIFETVAKGDSNPGSLDCESGILFSVRVILCYYFTFYMTMIVVQKLPLPNKVTSFIASPLHLVSTTHPHLNLSIFAFIAHVSLPHTGWLLIHAWPLILSEGALDVRKDANSQNCFHAHFTLAVTVSSAPSLPPWSIYRPDSRDYCGTREFWKNSH